MRQIGMLRVTLQVAVTVADLSGMQVNILTSNIGRPDPTSPAVGPSKETLTIVSATDAGFTATATSGRIAAASLAVGTQEATASAALYGQLVWVQFVRGTAGGTVSATIQVAGWSI